MKRARHNHLLINFSLFLAATLLAGALATPAQASDEASVRSLVERVFQQLKKKEYGALYDALPSSSRSRLSRDRFAAALRRAQDTYELDRIDIGSVRVANNLAVVDTVLYGRLVKPFQTEGKIVVQQYLIREDGQWRIATGDNVTTRRFLAGNPAFAKKFPIRAPRVYIKQNGNWVEFTPPRSSR